MNIIITSFEMIVETSLTVQWELSFEDLEFRLRQDLYVQNVG